jgi:hypothetical protein
MARLNIFGAKAKYMALFFGVSVSILVWLNMTTREGFQNVPGGDAQPVPMDSISAQKKQDFASAVIQLYHNIIIAAPLTTGVQTVPAAQPGTAPPGAMTPPDAMAPAGGTPPAAMPPPAMPPPAMPPMSQ